MKTPIIPTAQDFARERTRRIFRATLRQRMREAIQDDSFEVGLDNLLGPDLPFNAYWDDQSGVDQPLGPGGAPVWWPLNPKRDLRGGYPHNFGTVGNVDSRRGNPNDKPIGVKRKKKKPITQNTTETLAISLSEPNMVIGNWLRLKGYTPLAEVDDETRRLVMLARDEAEIEELLILGALD
jgi:hypothetical protein